MCVVSMVMDHYSDKWKRYVDTYPIPPQIYPPPDILSNPPVPIITREEIEEFKALLERAREYDKIHNQPNCELEEKKQALKKIAEQMGVDISFI